MSNYNVLISTVFKGEIADNAEIKSRDIIKAIEGFEESIAIISKNIYGKDCSISCTLKAPKKGSFELNYIFQFIGIAPMLFNTTHIEQLPSVISMMYGLFIKTDGKKIKNIEQNSSGSGVNLILEDNNTIAFNNCIFSVDNNAVKETLNNDKLRDAITKSHSPIINQSAREVTYKDINNKELSTVTRDNYRAFNPLAEKLTEDKKEMELWVKGLSFDGKKWDFKDKKMGEFFSAPIKDDKFQKILLEGEAFKNGDSIIANVFIKYSDKQCIRNKYTITEVIKHIIAPTQMTVF